MRFAVLVIWKDGESEYLYRGNEIAIFSARSRAQDEADFLREGMDVDDAQSINVVKAPALRKIRKG